MATQAQIEANRRNSLLSTGPRTDSGRSASARNSLRTGLYAKALLLQNEDAAAFDALSAEYFDSCRPEGPRETALVLELLRSDWLLRRMDAIETQIWHTQLRRRRNDLGAQFDESRSLALSYYGVADHLVVLQRRVSALSRTYHRALQGLQRLQAARLKSAAPAPAPAPEIGFVPPISDPAPTPEPPHSIGFIPSTPTARARPSSSPNGPAPCATIGHPTALVRPLSGVENVHTCGPLRSLLNACKIR